MRALPGLQLETQALLQTGKCGYWVFHCDCYNPGHRAQKEWRIQRAVLDEGDRSEGSREARKPLSFPATQLISELERSQMASYLQGGHLLGGITAFGWHRKQDPVFLGDDMNVTNTVTRSGLGTAPVADSHISDPNAFLKYWLEE